MTELVDVLDLKSSSHCGSTGSTPVPGTIHNNAGWTGDGIQRSLISCTTRVRVSPPHLSTEYSLKALIRTYQGEVNSIRVGRNQVKD